MPKHQPLLSYKNAQGFSLIELLIVILIMSIFAGFTIIGLSRTKYAADDNSLKVYDLLQEARQKTLTQRTVMRFEINSTKRVFRLINEKTPDKKGTADDAVIKTVPFDDVNLLTGNKPEQVKKTPVTTSPAPEIKFDQTVYPLSQNDLVFTLCFVKDGRVLETDDKGNCDEVKNVVRGATIYFAEKPDSSNKIGIIRAITVNGISGAVDFLRCQTDGSSDCKAWVK